MLELFASENYKVVVDGAQQGVHAGESYIELKGWAADFLRKQALPIAVPALPATALRRMTREDISTLSEISPNEKLGFALRVPTGCPLVELELSSPGETWAVQLDMQKVRRTFTLLRVRHLAGRAFRVGTGLFTEAGRDRIRKSLRRRLRLDNRAYEQWVRAHETMTRKDAQPVMEGFAARPLVSVVTPVYNVDEQWLRRCVASMQEQWYDNWELCLADDCSPDAHVRTVLEDLAAAEPRIKICFRAENGGISAATNSAIELATGDLVGFMDNDDELAPQALFEVVRAFNQDEEIDFVYTDEDKIDELGHRFDPFFKPGFSQQLLWSHNYITHFVVVRRTLLDRVGGLRGEFNGSQDYDFILRATRAARRVHHIPAMLYHWRTIETSVAGDPRSKLYAYEAGRKALEESVRAAGFEGATVDMLPNLGTYHVDYAVPDDTSVFVALGRGMRDKVEEVRASTAYRAATIEVCENSAEALERAERCQASFIVFIDDVVPTNRDWLEEMLGFMGRPGVGAVGGKIVDRFHQIVNSGVTLRALKTGEIFEGAGNWDGDVGYYFRTSLPRDIFAVTEDCLCVRVVDFKALGGFDESMPFGIRGIDYCVRLQRELDKTTIWEPFSTFLCAQQSYRAISAPAVEAYLRGHEELNDRFASAWFPPSQTRKGEEHVLAYQIDSVRRVDGVVEIVGWAANIHSGNKVSIAIDGLSPEAAQEAIARCQRLDVSRALLISEEANLGFTIRIKTDKPVVVLRFSIPEEERVARVKVSAAALRSHRVRRLLHQAAQVRHPRSFMRKAKRKFVAPQQQKKSYEHYIASVEPSLWASSELAYRPLISIVVPVYNVESRWLERCVASVQAQTYDNWELCFADDCSSDPAVRPALEALAASDARIKVVFREENGHISRATNSALELATGEFIALMDNDDELSPHALFEVVAALNENRELDLIYSDEDKIDESGVRSDPTFKPDYSPDLLLSTNYISHLGVYRASIVRELGGFRAGYEGSQDYDLVLRFVERSAPERVRHIPRILYHWRMLATSTAADQGSKGYAFTAGQRALQDALDRRGLDASADTGPLNGIYNVHYRLPEHPGRVSVIIPTRDGYDNIDRCITSIIEKTDYEDYEILIADNGSENPKMRELYKRLDASTEHPVRVLDIDIPFNYARINNLAAQEATGDYLLFLNDDTEVIAPGWMTTMVGLARQERVGMVGAKLYYPNNHVQHAGVVLGLGGVAGHIFVGAARGDVGRYGRLLENANYYAVTAACCLVKAADFRAVGGFDEELAVAYNDVDLCIRIHDELGRDNVVAHEAELYHFESVTRGHDTEDAEKTARLERESARFYERYRRIVDADPYYNENLSRTSPYLDVREA